MWRYLNKNPLARDTNDCVIRSISCAENRSWDDVYLELVEIEKFRFESSHVFHYTDEETGNLKVFLHEFYHDSSLVTTSRANFFIFDGESKVAESLDVPFTDGTALFTYSVPKVLKKKGNIKVFKV